MLAANLVTLQARLGYIGDVDSESDLLAGKCSKQDIPYPVSPCCGSTNRRSIIRPAPMPPPNLSNLPNLPNIYSSVLLSTAALCKPSSLIKTVVIDESIRKLFYRYQASYVRCSPTNPSCQHILHVGVIVDEYYVLTRVIRAAEKPPPAGRSFPVPARSPITG